MIALRNTELAWGLVAIVFHWLIALLILGQFVLGWIAEDMRLSPDKLELFVWHKSLGITVLLLVALRLAWRLLSSPPAALSRGWETRFAKLGHALLYLLMFAVPLSGWWVSDTSRIPFRIFWHVPTPNLMEADKAASELAAQAHGTLTTLLLVIVVVHILAALRHHFWLHDATLARMLPQRKAQGD